MGLFSIFNRNGKNYQNEFEVNVPQIPEEIFIEKEK